MIKVTKLDEVYLTLSADTSSVNFEQDIKQLLFIEDKFSRYADNYQQSYAFKSNKWDGLVRYLRQVQYGVYIFPIGLFTDLIQLCDVTNIDLDIQFDLGDIYSNIKVDWGEPHLQLPLYFEKRQYQFEYVDDFFRLGRCCIISPTGSGKSAIIYMIMRHLIEKIFTKREKILLVVPTVDLITQMYDDFKSYGFHNIDDLIFLSNDKKNASKNPQLFIYTWQSLQNLKEEFFEQFFALIVDESHGVSQSAEKLTWISHNCINARFRLGTTGTIPEKSLNEMNMTAYLGQIVKRTSTSQLIQENYLSPLGIKSTILVWKSKERYDVNDFQSEYKTIVECEERQDLVVEVCKKMLEKTKGTVLVLGRRVDYLESLVNKLDSLTNEDIYLVTGKHMKNKKLRKETYTDLKKSGGVFFATTQLAGTGINIPNIDVVILATPIKAKVPILQAIGRGTRLSPGKKYLEVIDFIDKIPLLSKKINSSYKWVHNKDNIYNTERFTNKFYIMNLKTKNKNQSI